MKIVNPSFHVLSGGHYYGDLLVLIKPAGRTCYKSGDKITKRSAEKLIKSRIKRDHHSIMDHENIALQIICDRDISHEFIKYLLDHNICGISMTWVFKDN